MNELTYAYLGGLTAKRGTDGFLYVKGLVSDDTLDIDQQRCDPSWLDTAVPKWLKSAGNVRVMHQPVVGGKAKEIEKLGSGWGATIKVTNAQAAIDIEEGAITGLSIGIRNAGVEKSATAPNGLITSGDIVEVSLVDRPANPSCSIEIAKMADDAWAFKGVEVDDTNHTDLIATEMAATDGLDVSEQVLPCAACGGTGKTSEVPGITCARCNGTGEEPKDAVEDDIVTSPSSGDAYDNLDDQKGVEIDKAPLSGKATNDLPDSAFAYIEPGGKKDDEGKTTPRSLRHFPVHDKAHARNALARASQSPFGDKAMAKIKAACKKFGIEVSAKGALDELLTKAADGYVHDPADIKDVLNGICDLAIAELDEMKEGEDEIWDVGVLLNALSSIAMWANHEANGGETAPPFNSGDDDMTNAFVALGANADLLKVASSDEATDDQKNEARADLLKVLGVDAVVEAQKETIETLQKSVSTLQATLEEVLDLPADGGPVLRQTSEQRRKSAAHDAVYAEIRDLRSRAEAFTGDVSFKRALSDRADELEATLKSL